MCEGEGNVRQRGGGGLRGGCDGEKGRRGGGNVTEGEGRGEGRRYETEMGGGGL